MSGKKEWYVIDGCVKKDGAENLTNYPRELFEL